jgi:hypothetical protein
MGSGTLVALNVPTAPRSAMSSIHSARSQGHLVTSLERGFDDVTAEEERPAQTSSFINAL